MGGKTMMPIIRGIGYAITSLLAFIAGSFINGFFVQSRWDLIGISSSLWLISLPFFFVYVYNYNYDGKDWVFHRTIFVLVCIVITLLTVLVLSFLADYTRKLFFVLLITQAILTFLLSAYYLKLMNVESNKYLIRNWLIVPVIFSIGMSFSFSFAINYIDKGIGLTTYLPFIIFAIYFTILCVLGNKLTKHKYFLLSIILFASIFIGFLTLSFVVDAKQILKTLLVSIVLSAFIASFESWRITFSKIKDTQESVGSHPFYKATSVALMLSLTGIPLLLLSEYFNLLFYLLVILGGISACFYWFYKGSNSNKFRGNNWVKWKNLFGFGVLLSIVVDSLSKIAIPLGLATFYDFFQFPSLFAVVGIFFYLANSFFSEYVKYQQVVIDNQDAFKDYSSKKKFSYIVSHMTDHPKTFNKILGMISFLPFIVIFLIDVTKNNLNTIGNFAPLTLQMRAAELMYVIISLLCIIADIGQKLFDFEIKVLPLPSSTHDYSSAPGRVAKLMLGIFRLVRFPTSIFIGMIVALPYLLSGYNLLLSVLAGLPFTLSAMTGFAINDCLDYRKDRISKPHRAIPSNLVSIYQSYLLSSIICILAIIFSLYSAKNASQLILYFGALVGVILYNFVVKHAAILKTLCAAFICILPIIFVLTSLGNSLLAILLSTISFIYILGREIRMDILDQDGDRQDNISTLPILFGIKFSKLMASIAIYLSISFACILIVCTKGAPIGYLLSGLVILLQIICEVLWFSGTHSKMRKSVLLQWFPMLTSFIICVCL